MGRGRRKRKRKRYSKEVEDLRKEEGGGRKEDGV